MDMQFAVDTKKRDPSYGCTRSESLPKETRVKMSAGECREMIKKGESGPWEQAVQTHRCLNAKPRLSLFQ